MASRIEDEGDPHRPDRVRSPQWGRHGPRIAPVRAGQDLEGGTQVLDTPGHRALHGRQLETERGVGGLERRGVWDPPEGRLQRGDATALRRPAQRPQPIVPEAERAHAARDGGSLTSARRPRRPGPIPRVHRGSPELALGVPADRDGRAVRPPERNGSGASHPLDRRRVSGREGVRQDLEALRRRRPDHVDVGLDGEWHAVESRQRFACGSARIGRRRGCNCLVAQDDRDRVEGRVDLLDAPEVRLCDLPTAELSRANQLCELGGAQPPQLADRDRACSTRHRHLPIAAATGSSL